MFAKVKQVIHDDSMRLGIAAMLAVVPFLPLAGAAEDVGSSSVVPLITGAADSLKADAITVIGVAIGIGIVFFGAGLLWRKFKSMSK